MDQKMQKIMLKGMLAEAGEDVTAMCNEVVAELSAVTDKRIQEIKDLAASDNPEDEERSQKLQAALGCAVGIYGIELTEQLEDL